MKKRSETDNEFIERTKREFHALREQRTRTFKYIRKAKELSQMVVKLLKAAGMTQFNSACLVLTEPWWYLNLLTFLFGGVDTFVPKWELRGPRTYIKTENGKTHESYQYLLVKLIQAGEDYYFIVGEQNIKTPDATFKSLTQTVLKVLKDNSFSRKD